jgi:hypothetical protein
MNVVKFNKYNLILLLKRNVALTEPTFEIEVIPSSFSFKYVFSQWLFSLKFFDRCQDLIESLEPLRKQLRRWKFELFNSSTILFRVGEKLLFLFQHPDFRSLILYI